VAKRRLKKPLLLLLPLKLLLLQPLLLLTQPSLLKLLLPLKLLLLQPLLLLTQLSLLKLLLLQLLLLKRSNLGYFASRKSRPCRLFYCLSPTPGSHELPPTKTCCLIGNPNPLRLTIHRGT
jgi:hypothetical protein